MFSEEINIDSEDTTTTTNEDSAVAATDDDAAPAEPEAEPEKKARPRSESWLAKLGRSIKQTAQVRSLDALSCVLWRMSMPNTLTW